MPQKEPRCTGRVTNWKLCVPDVLIVKGTELASDSSYAWPIVVPSRKRSMITMEHESQSRNEIPQS